MTLWRAFNREGLEITGTATRAATREAAEAVIFPMFALSREALEALGIHVAEADVPAMKDPDP